MISPSKIGRALTGIVSPRESTRYALGVATCLVLIASLLAGCKDGPNEVSSGGSETCTGCTLDVDEVNVDAITGDQHLYLKSPDGTKFEIGVGNDASGKYAVTATPAK